MKETHENPSSPSAGALGSGAGSGLLNEFLADFDRRISDGNKQTPEAIKENLRRMRPAVLLLAENDPEGCDRFLRRWMATHMPPNDQAHL
jgi:hypothetical protein